MSFLSTKWFKHIPGHSSLFGFGIVSIRGTFWGSLTPLHYSYLDLYRAPDVIGRHMERLLVRGSRLTSDAFWSGLVVMLWIPA